MLFTGLIKPTLRADGQVCVDMGEPILQAEKVPTTLKPNSGKQREEGWQHFLRSELKAPLPFSLFYHCRA